MYCIGNRIAFCRYTDIILNSVWWELQKRMKAITGLKVQSASCNHSTGLTVIITLICLSVYAECLKPLYTLL